MYKRIVLLAGLFLSVAVGLPAAEAGPTAQTAGLQLFSQTEHFDIYLAPGSLTPGEAQQFAAGLEPTLAQVARRFGNSFPARERVELLPPQQGACAIRGLTFSGQRLIQLFYGPGSDLERMQSLMAHELVHQLQREYFGDAKHQAADVILLEGWATVASDAFARTPAGNEPRWRARVREVVQRDELLPLTTDLERDCRTTTRNAIYDQWASFVSFLEQAYGRAALINVYGSGAGRAAGSADYRAVYGKTFAQLEADWRAWVMYEQPIEQHRRALRRHTPV